MPLQLAPKRNFQHFADQITSIVDEMVGRQFVRFSPTDVWQPHVNLYEVPDAFIVCVNLAGMKVEEIQVEVRQNHLTIRGKRPPPIPVDVPAHDIRVHLMEIDSGDFARDIEFHLPIREERIAADYRDGMLWITVPRGE